MTGHRSAETPRSDVSYAGFPVHGVGLQCPVCALDVVGVHHEKDGSVIVVHQLMRSSRERYDVWKCIVQPPKKGTM